MKSFDLAALGALENEIITLCGHMHAAEYRLLELIRRMDEMNPWGNYDVASCAHWLNWKCGIDLGAARQKVRTAHALARLPLISEAFRKGELSYSKVRAITRVATPESESDFLGIATSATAAHVEKIVRKYRQVARLQEAAGVFDQFRTRTLNCRQVEDGSWLVEGRLAPEQGAMLRQALERGVDWLYRGQPPSYRCADNDERVEDVPMHARRADALVALAERFLSRPLNDDDCQSSADRFLVTVHVSAETLEQNGAIDPDDPPQIEDGPVLAPETVRRIACDCALVPMLETRRGEPLNVGRKARTCPPALRRALKRRDGGCRFPGCVNTRFTAGHHVEHWVDGGETSLDNTLSLCPHHHRLVHEGGYHVVADNGDFVFLRPDGSIVPVVNDAVLTGDLEALIADQAELDIDEHTTVPAWDGARADYGYILNVLCYRHELARRGVTT